MPGRAGRRVAACLLLLAPFVAVGANSWYVDSAAATGGDGSSATPYKTIRAALDASDANDTIWVRGGEDRSYTIATEADTLPIPETKEGLSIRVWGGEGLAEIAVADGYATNIFPASTPVISNVAANVTLQGLRFTFTKDSLGKYVNGKGKLGENCHFIQNFAPCLTLSGCTFELVGDLPDGSYSKSLEKPLVVCNNIPATNLLVEGCAFFNCRENSADENRALFRVRDDARFVGNVFSNVTTVLSGIQLEGNRCTGPVSFVSNLVYQASNEKGRGVLLAGYAGPRKMDVAYNRFVNDGDEPLGVVVRKFREGCNNGLDFHHNTVVGFKTFICADSLQYASTYMTSRIFDNIFILATNATNVVENSTGPIHGYLSASNWQPTMFRPGSFYVNNALLTGTFNGGTATEIQRDDWHYDLLAGLAISNTYVLSSAFSVPTGETFSATFPVFVRTNDMSHANFYRPRAKRSAEGVNYGRIGWRGSNNEYPPYIGALPPLYPAGFSISIR